MLYAGEVSISEESPSLPGNDAINLITNLSSRSSGNNQNAIIDTSGTRAGYESCYKTTSVELGPEGDKLIITINLGRIAFVHSLIAVQDLYNGYALTDHLDTSEYTQNIDFHIGNDPDYTKNQKCAGGPFMVVGEADSYSKDDAGT